MIIGLSPSALRGVLFFILFSINKIYYFYIKPQNIFIVVLSISLLINPYYIYEVGFQYSFLISLILLLTSSSITGNYLQKLLKTSILSFLISIPISLYNYYQRSTSIVNSYNPNLLTNFNYFDEKFLEVLNDKNYATVENL